ncbi:MAG TPA: FkbM family methyltransferase [Terriglobia bacterium]|nr:FkbM family methyltransferase [Terriglobia bacterium]
MQDLLIAVKDEGRNRQRAIDFCAEFRGTNRRPKFVFGCTSYAHDILKGVEIDAFVDDLFQQPSYLGKPVIRSTDIPSNALVVAASVFRPTTMKAQLDSLEVESLDFFAFCKFSGLNLKPAAFSEGNAEDYGKNRSSYQTVYELLEDDLSKSIFRRLLSFRVTNDISHLTDFSLRDKEQYFEDFLGLEPDGETFVDVGGFDAYTSRQFMKRCPQYREVHLFEPELKNYEVCRAALKDVPRVFCYNNGLSDKQEVLKFSSSGSASQINEDGDLTIKVERLDSLDIERPTFIKMDIEGAEKQALAGGSRTIEKHHPRLAIAAYHRPGDFWKLPYQVRAIRDDYRIYMRHYAESLYETVLFFIPKR